MQSAKAWRRVRSTVGYGLLVAGLVTGLMGAPTSSAHGDDSNTVTTLQATRTCSTAFEVGIHEGPSAPLLLAGALTLQIDESGRATGSLTRNLANAAEAEPMGILPTQDVPVVGQVNGYAINLTFLLGDNQEVFGVGASTSDLSTCAGPIDGVIGGPAVGPQPGDRGDWFASPRLQLCVPGWYCIVLLL